MVCDDRNEKVRGTSANGRFAVAMTLGEIALHLREHLGRRALEGEDGLLLVANREDGAVRGPRASAGEKLGAERGEDAPLRLGRVLSLIEQQVVEAIVELVEHPGGARPRHQRERARDLIVEVQRAALSFHAREGGQDGSYDDEQGGAPFQRQGRAPALAQDLQARLLTAQIVFERRVGPGADPWS